MALPTASADGISCDTNGSMWVWSHVMIMVCVHVFMSSVAMTIGRGEGQTQGEGAHHHGPLWGPRYSQVPVPQVHGGLCSPRDRGHWPWV